MNLPGVLTRNLGTKVLALCIAAALFLSVNAQERTTVSLQYELEVGELPEEMVLLSPLPEVTVTISGPRSTLLRLRDEGRRTLRLPPLRSDQTFVRLNEADLRLPAGASASLITPMVLPVELDLLVHREIPVRARLRNQPPEGYELTEVHVRPDSIGVSGPRSVVESLETIYTQSLDVGGLRSTRTFDVDLAPLQAQVTVNGSATVSVEVGIELVEERRELERVAVELVGRRIEGLELRDTTQRVVITGPKSLVDNLNESGVFSAIETAALPLEEPGVYTVEAELRNLPSGVRVLRQEPRLVRVRIPAQPDAEPRTEETGGP